VLDLKFAPLFGSRAGANFKSKSTLARFIHGLGARWLDLWFFSTSSPCRQYDPYWRQSSKALKKPNLCAIIERSHE
jgi:hypothetical protein